MLPTSLNYWWSFLSCYLLNYLLGVFSSMCLLSRTGCYRLGTIGVKMRGSLASPGMASNVTRPGVVPLFEGYIWISLSVYTSASGPPSHLDH